MQRFTVSAGVVREECAVKIQDLRLSVLTPYLLRLEQGSFTDLPTQTVWNRDFPAVAFTASQVGDLFTIDTGSTKFCVDLRKGKMRSITLANGTVVTDFYKGNLLGTARTLDMVNGSTKLQQGILSRSGVAVMDDSKSLLLREQGKIMPRPQCTDQYYFAYGHGYRNALRDFFTLTGPVPLIPKFALGNWWSRYRAYTQEEYRTLMQEFLDRKIPITVATIDMDWHWTDVIERFGPAAEPGPGTSVQDNLYNRFLKGWTGYSWNTELFPDHRELLDWLHRQNFHVTLNVHPSQGIRYYENCYPQVCAALGKDPESREKVRFDITDADFVKAYFDIVHHPLENEGVDFWWLDWQQGTNTAIPGLDPLWALNHYHTLDSASGNKRPLILSRYAGFGSHRYPLGFSGDTFCTWESLDFQPYFTNTAANAGYTWWSHDIGGHQQGRQDDELYLRWLQYGVFSPINRLHSSNSDFMGKEPWKHSYVTEKLSEEFLRLRHKLIPFLYTANYQTHTEGTPLCMPMYYDYDQDEAYEAKNQYIFASQLLVCPVTKPSDRRLNLAATRVWLPEGRWTDIFNGRIYSGGRWVTMYRDLDSIPVLAPAGAIVPMYANGERNDLGHDQPLEVHVWRGCGEYEMYDDDGETTAFRHGAYALTRMEVSQTGDQVSFVIHPPVGNLSVLPAERAVTIRFRDITSATVAVNGACAETVSGREVAVPICMGREPVTIELSDCVFAANRPIQEYTVNLLTRVQAGNNWKQKTFRKKYPAYIRDALAELDALYYE